MTTDTTTDTPTEAKPTGTEVLESLTGFDEIAIARAFGADVTDLRKKPFTFLRALCFIQFRRDGAKDPEAYRNALILTIAQVNDRFEDEPTDDDQDDDAGDVLDQLAAEDDDLDLATPAGKGAARPGS